VRTAKRNARHLTYREISARLKDTGCSNERGLALLTRRAFPQTRSAPRAARHLVEFEFNLA